MRSVPQYNGSVCPFSPSLLRASMRSQRPGHANAMQNPNQAASSAFSPVPQLGQVSHLPEISLFSQLAPFYAQGSGQVQQGGLTQQQLQLYQLQLAQTMQAQQAASAPSQTKSESKSSSAYASRHQAAEQRRRNRINERLDKLRTLVPHAERANTASFLEEVIHYIEELQALLKCGPNHATGAPATHPSLTIAAAGLAAHSQQLQRQPQAPLDLSLLTGSGSVQQPQLPQQPATASGMYPGAGPYGVATPNGTFEVLHPQHPMAGLHASLSQPIGQLQPLPENLQQQLRQPASFNTDLSAAAAVLSPADPQLPPQPAAKRDDPGTPPTGAAAASPPSGSSGDQSEGRPLKKRQRGGSQA